MQSNYALIDKMINEPYGKIKKEHKRNIDAGPFSEFMSQKSTVYLAVDFYLRLGMKHYSKQKYDLAIDAYKTALLLDGTNWKVHNNIGSMQLEQKDYANAIKSYTQSIELRPNEVNTYCNLAVAHYFMNNDDEAITNCIKAMKLNLQQEEPYNVLAKIHERQTQWALVIVNCDTAIKINTNNHVSFQRRAKAHAMLKAKSEAIKDYTQALRIKPDCATTAKNLYKLLCNINKNDNLNTLDKTDLFNAITKLPAEKQLPLLERCRDKTDPFGILMHKPRNSMVNVVTMFGSNPNDYGFIKCDKSKGMLRKIDEQIYAVKQKLNLTDSEEEWTDENSEEDMFSLKKF